MTIGERIRLIRKDRYAMTQEEFAGRLNLSRSNLGNVETGRIEPTERLILDICREFSISEQWLRTGEGNIFRQLSENEQLLKAMTMIEMSDDHLIKSFLIAYCEMPEEQRAVLREIAVRVMEHYHRMEEAQ